MQDAAAPFVREGKPICDASVHSEIPSARYGCSRMRRSDSILRAQAAASMMEMCAAAAKVDIQPAPLSGTQGYAVRSLADGAICLPAEFCSAKRPRYASEPGTRTEPARMTYFPRSAAETGRRPVELSDY